MHINTSFPSASVQKTALKKILFCISLLTALACNLLAPMQIPVPPTTAPDAPFCQSSQSINEKANGQTVRLNKGDFLRVELRQNASTGYEWLVDSIEPEKVTDMGKDYNYDANLPPGSGGTQLLCFQAVNSGATTLRLIYRQPWNVNVTPDPFAPPDFEITIVINE